MKAAVWLAVLSATTIDACGGTETQNPGSPLKSFSDSGCKKERGAASSGGIRVGGGIGAGFGAEFGKASQALVSTNYGAETAGLQCFAWEVLGSNRLKVDLYNFEGACGADWVGAAALVADGSLRLNLTNPACALADCGSCIYDWSFELDTVELNRPLPVTVSIDTCPGEQALRGETATLPVNASVSGILCNYADFSALGWQAVVLKECGTAAMPCNGTMMCQSTSTTTGLSCQGDLQCSDNGNANEAICVKTCTADSECGSLGVQTCQGGLCRPADHW